MKCDRSAQLDLAAFLAGEANPEVDDFRAHYRSCPDCSAEMRVWMELHTQLDPDSGIMQHPSEDLLLRFEAQPEKMGAVARSSVETHLEACPSCRDELQTLRRFDFSILQQSAAGLPPTLSSPRKEQPAWWKDLLAPVRTVLLHPAFAYGLVLLLLLPQLASLPPALRPPLPAAPKEQPERRKVGGAPPVASSDFRSGAEQVEAERRDETANARLAEKARPEPAAEAPVGGAVRRDSDPHSRQKASRDALERFADVGSVPFVAKKREVDSLGARQAPNEAGFEEAKDANKPAAQLGMAGALRDDTADDKRNRDERQVLTIEMDPSGRNNLPVQGLLGGATMRIKPQQPLRLGSEVAIRIKSADGRRELREIHVAARDDGYLEMTIPPGWMSDGRYSVEALPLGDLPKSSPHRH